MSSIDNRVVVLTFDNKNFEKNVQTSMSTLDKLKNGLKFDGATKGLEKLSTSAKAINFNPIGSAIESIKNRFTNLGIVGMTILQNLTNTAVDFGKRLVNSIFTPITQGGWKRALDIEQATFQMEGLIGNTEGGAKKIQAIMEQVTESVKGTAFGANEAARVASQLVATGIEDASKMRKYLDGVAGAAAMTGGAYDEIGHIFTTVAGQGRLMGDQLNQFAYRGLNVAATLSKQMGITEQEFRELVSKGQISFEQFAEGMAEAFGSQAVKANETFTGSLSNMKAALARIGQDVAAPSLTYLRDLFNSLRLLIDAAHEKLKPFINTLNNGLTKAAKKATGFVDNLTEALGGTSARMKEEMNGTAEVVEETATVVSKSSEEIEEMARRVISGEFGYGVDKRREQLESLGYSFEEVQNKVNELLGSSYRYEVTEKEIAETTKEVAEETDKLSQKSKILTANQYYASQIFQNLKFSLTNILNSFKRYGKAFKEAFVNSFSNNRFVVGIRNISEAFKTFTQKLNLNRTELTGLQKIWEGVFNVLHKGVNIVLKGVEYFFKFGSVIADLRKKFLGFIGSMYDANGQIDETTRRGQFLAAFGGVVEKVGEALTGFKDKVKEVIDRVQNTGGFIKLKETFGEIWEKLKETGGNILDSVIEKMQAFAGIDLNFDWLDKIVPLLGKAAGHVADFIDACSNGFSGVKDFFKGLFGVSEEEASPVVDTVDKVTSKIDLMEERLSDFTGGKSKTFWDRLKGIRDFIVDLKDRIVDFFSGNIDESFKNTSFSENIKTFLSGLGQAFLSIVEEIDWGKLIANLPKILIAVALIRQLIAVSRLTESIRMLIDGFTSKAFRTFNSTTNQFKNLATGILMIAASLFIVAAIPTDRLITAGIVLSVISVVIVLAMKAFQKMNQGENWDKMKKGTTEFVEMAAAMLLVAIALRVIGGMDTGDVIKAGLAITAIVAVFTIAAKAMKNVKSGTASFIAMAIALDLLIPAVLVFGHMKTESLIKAGVSLLAFLSSMALACRMAKSAAGGAASMVIIALALDLLIPAVLVFGNMKTEKLVQGGLAIIAFMTSLALATRIASSAIGGAASMAIMAMALNLLIPAVLVFGNMDTGKLVQGGVAIVALMTALAAVTRLAQGSLGGALSMMAMVVPLTVIAIALNALANNDWQSILAAAAALGGVMLALGVALNLASTAQPTGALALDLVSLAIIPIAAALSVLADYEWQSLLAAATALGGVMLAAAAVLRIIQGMDVVSAVEASVAFSAGLDIILLNITGITALIGWFDEISNGAFKENIEKGREVLEAAGLAIGGLVGAIGEGLTDHLPAIGDNLSGFSQNASDFFSMMSSQGLPAATAIAELAGAFTLLTGAELIDGLRKLFGGESTFETFGKELASFGPNLKTFADETKGITAESIEGPAKGLAALATAADSIPNEGGWLAKVTGDNSLATFGEELAQFGPNLSTFKEAIGDVSEGDFTGAASAITELAGAADGIPNTGGWLAKVTGDNSLSKFGQELAKFGPNLNKFKESIGDVSEGDFTGAASAITELAKAADGIPSTGGWLAKVTGDNSLAKFGQELAKFGPSLASLKTDAGGIGEGDLTGVAQAISELGAAADSIPNEGGALGWLVGDNLLSKFGGELEGFGEHLKTFAGTVSYSAAAKAKIVADTVKILTNACDVLSGGTYYELTNFGGTLTEFADKMTSFCGTMAGNESDLATAQEMITSLATLVGDISAIDTSGLSTVGDALSEFGGFGLEALTGGVAESEGSTADAISSSLDNVASSVAGKTKFVEKFKEIAKKAIDEFKILFDKETKTATTKVKGFFDAAKQAIPSDFVSKFQQTGTNAATKFCSAISARNTTAYSAGSGLASSAYNGLSSGVNAGGWSSLGYHCAAGFASGLSSSGAIAQIVAAANHIVNTAKNTVRRGLEVNSPSKVFMRLGSSVIEGFVKGIDDNLNDVKATTTTLAETTIATARRQADLINNAFALDVNPEPVITPVVDLSNVRSGAAQLNTLLGTGPFGLSLGNEAMLSRLSLMASSNSDSNRDVVNAINGLKDKGLGKTTINITVDGAENPEDFVDRMVRSLKGYSRI